MEHTYKIAVLLTCHNRKEKTLACLRSLFECYLPEDHLLEVFLVDDGSTDGTDEAVKSEFPLVKLIYGNGDLYWNQGMRMAWENATKHSDYDFYFWLNDDTLLSEFALTEMLDCNYEGLSKDQQDGIISGACRSNVDTYEFSYGGKTDKGPVIPNGELQECKYINGNAVLVSKAIFLKLGYLSEDYTHGMGDFDYGLSAIQAGFNCYTTKRYIATCPRNEGIPAWCNPKIPLIRRWELMYSPNGLNLKEYITFRRKFWGWEWILFTLKVYLKVLFPVFYSKISNK